MKKNFFGSPIHNIMGEAVQLFLNFILLSYLFK